MDKKYLDSFIKQLSAFKSEKELKDFIEAIFTSKELQQIPKRLEIIKLLKQNIPQQIISNNLKVGIATVTRWSKELRNGKFKQIQN
jgi:TrpR family transcriptional regulator, trp operon repressor